jgi:putative tricarboxylic transport membrane protein
VSTPRTDRAATGRRAWLRDHSELGVCVLLLALGVLVLTDALTMDVDLTQRGPVGPRTVPLVVGGGLLLIAALLAVDVLRGGRGEAEGGEDVDLSEPADWRTVLLLAGVFLGAAVLIGPLGFPVAGALLFWGAAFTLGSRRADRDPLIAAVLSLVTYAVFDKLLGVPLPGGPLMGVL